MSWIELESEYISRTR